MCVRVCMCVQVLLRTHTYIKFAIGGGVKERKNRKREEKEKGEEEEGRERKPEE